MLGEIDTQFLSIQSKNAFFWERITKNSIIAALAEIEIWGILLDKAVELRRLMMKHAVDIDFKSDLPDELAMTFYTLYHHLQRYTRGPIDHLKVGFAASPPMRPYFDRQPQVPGSTKIQIVKRTGLTGEPTRDEIIWIIRTLLDEQQLHLAGLNTLMDELERIQNNEPKAKDLISSWVAHQISDLAILSYCRHQIDLYQPWAATFEDQMVKKKQEINDDFLHTQRSFEHYFNTEIGSSVVSLGRPEGGRFHYPAEKRRTRENVQAMRQAERNLDDFWHELDSKLAKVYASSPRVRALLSQRILERTPEWVEPVKPLKSAEANLKIEVEPLVKSLSALHFDTKQESTSTVGRDYLQFAKPKTKTRGTPSAPALLAPTESVSETSSRSDPQPKFSVDKRA